MSWKQLPGPTKLALAILSWAGLLWFFTLGNPSFVPVAQFIFGVLVAPFAAVEWVKMKGLLKEQLVVPVRIVLIIIAAVIWFTKMN